MMEVPHVLYFDDEVEDLTTAHGGPLEYILGYLREDLDFTIDLDCKDQLSQTETSICENKYDVIFLDIRIEPSHGGAQEDDYKDTEWERTGVRLIDRIRSGAIGGATPSNVPIIVITAVADSDTLEKIKTIGKGNLPCESFIRIIQKPPRLSDIEQALRQAVHYPVERQ
jgi:CheY-like chemotaxis protein